MALTASRAPKPRKFSSLDMRSTNEQVYKGGIACLDRSTGLVKKAAASTTLIPIGTYADDKLVTGNAKVTIDLFREIWAQWVPNSAGDAVVVGDIGSLCYLESDAIVAHSDATNTLSVAGLVWDLDATRGVCVEFRVSDSRLGGLDA